MSTDAQTAPGIPPQMRAWTYSRNGIPGKVLSLSAEVKTPRITLPTEVLVKVSYSGLNLGASISMQLIPYIFRAKSTVGEMDFSGVVAEVGADVPAERGLAPGVEVFGSLNLGLHLKHGRGSLGEYVVVPAASVILKPKNASLDAVAGLPIAGCTALSLIRGAELKPGYQVLVYGTSGGIGHLVLQMVKNAVGESGNVVAVCSGANAELAKSLGADEVIDYQAHHPAYKYLASRYSEDRFDVVVDAYGLQEMFENCEPFLKTSGRYVTVGPALKSFTLGGALGFFYLAMKNGLQPAFLGGVSRKYIPVMGFESFDDMSELAKQCEENKLRVVVDSCWSMDEAIKAYERLLSKRIRGKVLVKVQ